MAIKTWTTGEVVTASGANEFLTNAGLVFVKGVAQSGSVPTINVTSCFSATYDAYRVVLSSVTLTSNGDGTNIFCKMLSSTTPDSTNYNYGIPRVDLANGAISANYNRNGTAGIVVGTGNASNGTSAVFDVVNPFSANYTNFHGLSMANSAAGYSGAGSGVHAVNSSFNGLQFSASTGNISNAAIIVYGYRYGIS
jgi:hypothetical protein